MKNDRFLTEDDGRLFDIIKYYSPVKNLENGKVW